MRINLQLASSSTGSVAMESGLEALPPSSSSKLVKSKNPWGTPAVHPQGTCSLAAVMDEELAKTLQSEEETAYNRLLAVEVN